MAGAAQEITLEQLSKWAGFGARELAGLTFEKPLQDCKVLLQADMKKNFDEGHDPNGSPWPALAFPRLRGGDKPLRSTDVLMTSVTAQGQGHVEEITSFSLVLGTNLLYAALQNFGGTVHAKPGGFLAFQVGGGAGSSAGGGRWIFAQQVTIPARTFVGVSQQAQGYIVDVFAGYMLKKIG